ncbi:(deoxy)nucleoside triphosphate pyrophosphohydrolase [Croceicoccus ponticola]|uniref:8-oxo-dGTP diphosphatase n=1 Tax=Croceicoccus ponticola TaxID=2217664 RepID=A0A437GV56_9SPHN|nr:(deoxy)nucleoside triphosphate pyrophosphohydrolase [Croceicoccus ponticola]RVQ65288.1 (deoxy)nucleoside triphosphate pyrophosphohydrolase [Croceicoccus ponticola]
MLVVAAALLDGSSRVLMHRRPFAKHHGGLWEFPGGKVDPGEVPQDALSRELAEELGIRVEPHRFAPAGFATGAAVPGDDEPLVILLYTCRHWHGEPLALEGEEVRWCLGADCSGLDLAPLDRELLPNLKPFGIDL